MDTCTVYYTGQRDTTVYLYNLYMYDELCFTQVSQAFKIKKELLWEKY